MREKIKLTLYDIKMIDRYTSKLPIGRIEDTVKQAVPLLNEYRVRADQLKINKEN